MTLLYFDNAKKNSDVLPPTKKYTLVKKMPLYIFKNSLK